MLFTSDNILKALVALPLNYPKSQTLESTENFDSKVRANKGAQKRLALKGGKAEAWNVRPFQLACLLDMLKQLHVHNVLRIFDEIHSIKHLYTLTRPQDSFITEETVESVTPLLKEIHGICEGMGLKASLILIARTLDIVLEQLPTVADLLRILSEIQSRIEDEFESMKFLLVKRPNLYDETELFGTKVTANFPRATFDIEEAGKCLAIARHTACVFRLMRVVEIGVEAFGASLGVLANIKSAQPSWGQLLGSTDKEIGSGSSGGEIVHSP